MKYASSAIMLFLVVGFFSHTTYAVGCVKPIIDSVTPDTVNGAAIQAPYITISGSNFGSEVYVLFPNKQASPHLTSVSETEIVFQMPTWLEHGDHEMIVEPRLCDPEDRSNTKILHVVSPPSIMIMDNKRPTVGEKVTITGKYFRPDSFIEFTDGSRTIELEEVTETSFSFVVPDLEPGVYPYIVTDPERGPYSYSQEVALVVAPNPIVVLFPEIDEIVPSSAEIGDTITVNGSNFRIDHYVDVVGENFTLPLLSVTESSVTFKILPTLSIGSHEIRIVSKSGESDGVSNSVVLTILEPPPPPPPPPSLLPTPPTPLVQPQPETDPDSIIVEERVEATETVEEDASDIDEVYNAESLPDSPPQKSSVSTMQETIDEDIEVNLKKTEDEHDAAEERVDLIVRKVKERGAFRTFLFGSDDKQTKALKEEVRKNNQEIENLNESLGKVSGRFLKSQLEVRIMELEFINEEAEMVIQEQAKFSLFGWVKRLFN